MPIIEQGFGETIALRTSDTLKEWECEDRIVAMVMGTTASNTGDEYICVCLCVCIVRLCFKQNVTFHDVDGTIYYLAVPST